MSDVAESAKALAMRLLSRRWDDPPRTAASVDATISQLEQLRPHSRDADDALAIEEALQTAADVRRELKAGGDDAPIHPA
jgi:hypothetical protein